MLVGAIFLSLAVAAGIPAFPERMGDFVLSGFRDLSVSSGDREILGEYGLQAAGHADYADAQGKRMQIETFRFLDCDGAHAASLYTRPSRGVSPMIWNLNAVTAGGVTVVEYRNYVIRFYDALPSISSSLEEMLARLPDLIPSEDGWDLSGRYLDSSSEYAILGPVSLHRFASQIRPSVAGLHLGVTGRVGSFETPAGRVTAVVLKYPTEELAKERAAILAQLPSATVRVDRKCAGVVFGPADLHLENGPLSGSFCGPVEFAAPGFMWDEQVKLEAALSGVVLSGLILGGAVAVFRRFVMTQNPFPNRMTFLRL